MADASTSAGSGASDADADTDSDSGDELDVVSGDRVDAKRGGLLPRTVRKHWVVASGNATTFNSAKGVLEATTCDVLCLQETKLASAEALTMASQCAANVAGSLLAMLHYAGLRASLARALRLRLVHTLA